MQHRSRSGVAAALASLALAGCQHVPPAPLSPERSAAALEARSLDDPGLRSFIEAHAESPPAIWPPARWDLETLTLAAFYYQPALDVVRTQWAGAEAGIATAGARPNPRVTVTPEYTSNADAGVSPWLAAIHLDWRIETAGKRGHRIRQAEARSTAARYDVAGEAWRIRGALRAVLVDVVAARERVRLLDQATSTEQTLLVMLQDRVRAGAASLSDLTLPRLALLQSTADRADAERLLLDANARLAEQIGVPSRALEGIEIAFALETAGAPLMDLDESDAKRAALYGRPDVVAALARYAAAESALRLELARQYPDLDLGSGYQYDQGQNKWALGATIDLPLLDRNQGPIAEAEAARTREAARFVALQATVLAQVERAVANRRGAMEQVARLESMVAEATAQLGRIQTGLDLGAYDRVTLLGSQVEVTRGRLALLAARVELQRALGDLDAAVQGALPPNGAFARAGDARPGEETS